MSRDQIKTKVIDIIAEMVGVDHPPAGERISEETTLDDLGFDSMDVCEIEMSLLDEFGVDFNMDGREWQTVGSIITAVDSWMNCYSDC